MDMKLRSAWTIEQGVPVGPQVYRILRERIISGDLPPGTRLSEAELAQAYSLSRQPVREAFIKLAEARLVEVRPQRGTFVRKISTAAVMESRFVREAIEADVVKLLAAESDAGLVAELRRQLALQDKVPDNRPNQFLVLDERFHRTLAEAAGISYAWTIVEAIKSQMDRVRYLSALNLPKVKLVRQHTAIVDAIANGDASRADAAIRTHLREILTDLPEIAAAKPDYFEAAEDHEAILQKTVTQGGNDAIEIQTR